MPSAHRSPYSKALWTYKVSGFFARDLDLEEMDFIDRVRERGNVGAGGLGDLQSPGQFGLYGGWSVYSANNCSYRDDVDAAEAYGFYVAYKGVDKRPRDGHTKIKPEDEQDRFFDGDEDEDGDEHNDKDTKPFFAVESEEAKRHHALHYVEQAKRKIAFRQAVADRKLTLAMQEALNREHSRAAIARDVQTAEIEVDWARIERNRLLARIGRERRNRHRALKAAERELRRTRKVLRTLQGKINEQQEQRPDVDREGHARHSGPNGGIVGADQSQECVGDASAVGNGMRVENSGYVESGDDGSPPRAPEYPADQVEPRDAGAHGAAVTC